VDVVLRDVAAKQCQRGSSQTHRSIVGAREMGRYGRALRTQGIPAASIRQPERTSPLQYPVMYPSGVLPHPCGSLGLEFPGSDIVRTSLGGGRLWANVPGPRPCLGAKHGGNTDGNRFHLSIDARRDFYPTLQADSVLCLDAKLPPSAPASNCSCTSRARRDAAQSSPDVVLTGFCRIRVLLAEQPEARSSMAASLCRRKYGTSTALTWLVKPWRASRPSGSDRTTW
jgi:hypothetical protein